MRARVSAHVHTCAYEMWRICARARLSLHRDGIPSHGQPRLRYETVVVAITVTFAPDPLTILAVESKHGEVGRPEIIGQMTMHGETLLKKKRKKEKTEGRSFAALEGRMSFRVTHGISRESLA